jgi:hypothetical protein
LIAVEDKFFSIRKRSPERGLGKIRGRKERRISSGFRVDNIIQKGTLPSVIQSRRGGLGLRIGQELWLRIGRNIEFQYFEPCFGKWIP